MKDYIILNMESIISFITIFTTFVFGFIAKKYKIIPNKIIPVQNMIIMFISCLIYYLATKDFSLVVASGSPIATLFYDLFHNLKKEE